MNGLVIVGDLFEEVELFAPVDVWRRHKENIVVASVMKRLTLSSKSGIKVFADALIEDIKLDDFDFLFIPGGPGSYKILDKLPIVDEIINYFVSKRKLVVSICAAPMLVGKSGHLKDKNFTCFPGFEDQVIGGKLVESGVVHDDKFITGRSMYYSIDLAIKTIEILYNSQEALDLEESLKAQNR